MPSEERVAIDLVPRADGLEPAGVVGLGSVACALAERLLRLDDQQLQRLRGASGDDLLVVLGDPSALPWVDGCIYVGHDASAPRLLLPTARQPTFATELFERALLLRWPHLSPPVVVIGVPPKVFSAANALPIRRATLEAWLSSR